MSEQTGHTVKPEKITDAEKFVREKMPGVHIAGPMRNGKAHPEGGYMLFATMSCSGPYSCGKTVVEAWASATNRILAEVKP